MATAADAPSAAPRTSPGILRIQAISKLDAQLTCSVCLDRYVDPRVLTCHHSFCKNCISLIPQVREQERLVVKCSICRGSTQLGEDGPSALPVAFHIINLLEIDELLKKTPPIKPDLTGPVTDDNVANKLCPRHGRSLELYCETCEEFICFKCGTESHQQCHYDEFSKHKDEIKSCLKSLSERIQEVTDRLAIFDITGNDIKGQSEAVKNEIIQTIQEIKGNLERSKKFHLEQVERATTQKMQLNSLERGEAESLLTDLQKCKEFVEEELYSRSEYQIQEAKKGLVKHIKDTFSQVNMDKLQPSEEADTRFMIDRSAYAYPIGSVTSSLNNCQAVCDLASVTVPSQALAGPGQMTCVPVVMPILVSPEQMATTLSLQENVFHPSLIQVDEGYFVICLQPRVTGLHELSVSMNGIPVKSSPFTIPVLPSAETRDQGLDVVAIDLKCPYNSVITEDGHHIVLVEQEGNRVTILTLAGKVVRRFGKQGKGPGKFTNPHFVAVSSSNHIFVADLHSVQKFTFTGQHVGTVPIGVRALVFHPQSGQLLTISNNYSIEVFNLDLNHSHSLCELNHFADACDLAVDTKGMVYVLTIKHGIHKFSFDLKQHVSHIEVDDQLCLMGICVDKYDNIYVTDVSGNDKPIIMLTTEGECVARFGDQTQGVHGISVNRAGDLFVCCFNTGELVVYRA